MNPNAPYNVINYSFIDYIIKSYVPEIQFGDRDSNQNKISMAIFREAMLHESFKSGRDNNTYERLEYLGDAIFHMVITEYLYKRYDEENEGFLTKLRIRIERGDSMVELSQILELGQFVQTADIFLNDHILEDVFEAFIGAFYLTFGIQYTRKFIIKLIERHKDLSEIISHDDNYKDLLLRYFHQMKWGHPIYEKGGGGTAPPRGKFYSIVKSPFGTKLGTGISYSVAKAEQLASKEALVKVGVIINGEIDPKWIDKIDKVSKDKKEKDRTDKKTLSVYNPSNKLIKTSDIKSLLSLYNVKLPTPLSSVGSFNLRVFHEAMTHRSYLDKKKLNPEEMALSKGCVPLQPKSNERLKFLGDAIIHFIVGEYLYHRYQKANEGFLTRLRCRLENRESLFYLAKQTGLVEYVLISQNIEVLHSRSNVNIIGSSFESFCGALYLQFGLSIVRQFVLEAIREELDMDKIAENETNYKALILQLYNKNYWGRPEYRTMKEEGPDHCKIFTQGIFLNGKLMGSGKASTKGKAEQLASKKMYHMFVNPK